MNSNLYNRPNGANFWEGWLIFDDPSAERIIKEYLIPWFCPALLNVRTTVTSLEQINYVFNVLHQYEKFNCYCPVCENNNTWVVLTGSAEGEVALEELMDTYKFKKAGAFLIFSQPYFEYYYPPQFKQRVENIVYAGNRNMQARRMLLEEVLNWLKHDKLRGKVFFEKSAEEVISYLRKIDDCFYAQKLDEEFQRRLRNFSVSIGA